MDRTEALSSLRGKVEITESVKTRSVVRRQMVCSFDESSVDTPMNHQGHARAASALRHRRGPKKELKQLLVYFSDVGNVDLATVDWHIRFDRNDHTYRMLVNVCWLVSKGLLQTQDDVTSRLMD